MERDGKTLLPITYDFTMILLVIHLTDTVNLFTMDEELTYFEDRYYFYLEEINVFENFCTTKFWGFYEMALDKKNLVIGA